MRLDLPVIASNGAVMHTSARKPLQDVLTAIRLKCPVHDLGRRIDQNRERHLRPLEALTTIYPREMLEETCELADRCTFCMDELRYEYPKELVPPGLTPAAHLRQLTEAGALSRWPSGPPDDVTELVERN